MWTTLAHVARFGILLARTGTDGGEKDRQFGITYFVLDMQSPGIEVRPLVQMTGTHEFNEVFFTDVRVPAANVVGTVDDGWRLAKVTLGNERVSLSGEGALWGRGPTAQDVIDLVRAHGGTRDAVLRQRLAALYCEAEVLRLIRLRTLSARLRGLEPGPEASVRKALSDEHGQHVMETAKELAGTYGLLDDRGPYGEPDAQGWHYGYLYARALDDRWRDERSAAQHPRREGPRPPARQRVNVPDDVRVWLTEEHEAPPEADAWMRASNPTAERLLSLTRALKRPYCRGRRRRRACITRPAGRSRRPTPTAFSYTAHSFPPRSTRRASRRCRVGCRSHRIRPTSRSPAAPTCCATHSRARLRQPRVITPRSE